MIAPFPDLCLLVPFYSDLNMTNQIGRPVYAEKKVQVGKDQEKAQSEKDSHSKNRGGKHIQNTIRFSTYTM